MEITQLTGALPEELYASIFDLVEDAARVDAVVPLNEAARISLHSPQSQATHLIAHENHYTIGYAQLDPRDGSVQMVVRPARRRQGIASVLFTRLHEQLRPDSWWSFGTLEAAKGFAEKHNLRPTRQLSLMKRAVDNEREPIWPATISQDSFTQSDIDDLVKVNAQAFADHPEQGHMSAEDFRERINEEAFDPSDIILARSQDGRMAGFHWTKIDNGDEGEVYVLGVSPEFEGKGIGRALLQQGLAQMSRRGAKTVKLYVESDNDRVVQMYRNAGFVITNTDTAYQQTHVINEPSIKLDLPADRYSDRELSWLAFNNRVLDQAKDGVRVPLLERANFVSIFSSNLDEFFMVRVAGLRRRIDAQVATPSNAGILPRDLHEMILEKAHELVDEQVRVFTEDIRPALADEGIVILSWDQLSDDERSAMDKMFNERIFPVLTPLAVDPSHPFPYISGLSLNLGVLLRNPLTHLTQFARIKVPAVLDRFIQVANGRFLPMEDLIAQHLNNVFDGMQVLQHTAFRVTRNEDIEVEEDDAENILTAIEKELLSRKVGRPPVRLEVEDTIGEEMLSLLVNELGVQENEIFHLPAPLDFTGLGDIVASDREDLKYPGFLPKTHPDLASVETAKPADIFKALQRQDVLVHHPYDSFATSVERLIEQAAADPKVLAIKQTLYRTSGDSPIIDALIKAAKAGKQVLAVVEIKARFDEQRNIGWARKLEKYGVHVVYGMVGLKTHCKLMLVVRDEGEHGLRRYAHIGTGNYNPKTARGYEDMGLLTCNPVITDDVAKLFNHLSGMTATTKYRRLLVAPEGIRDGLIDRINNEIANAKKGKTARVRIKVNSIIDEAMIDSLYRASQAGVEVQLWVRGICGVRPQVPGLSENIRLISILGRYLEHSRIYWFENDGNPNVGIGSADLMHRNLDRRVEAIVGISNKRHIDQIDDLLNVAFDEGIVRWELTDRTWQPKLFNDEGQPLLHVQDYLIKKINARQRGNKRG